MSQSRDPGARSSLGALLLLCLALAGPIGGCGGGEPGTGGATPEPGAPGILPDAPRKGGSIAPLRGAGGARPASLIVPSLWEVRGPAGPVWILGTIHVGVSGETDLPPIVWEKLAAASALATEVDVRKVEMGAIMRAASLPPGESLDKMLAPAIWTKLVAALAGVLPEMSLVRLQPWFVVVAYTASLVPTARAMDSVLLETGERAGKELFFFETMDEQIGFLQKGIGVADLEELANEREKIERQLRELIAAYRKGDLEETARVIFDAEKMAKNPRQFEILLYDRNAAWLPALEKHIERGNVMVAVGLGHLLGTKGLVELLRAKGHEVVRIGAP